MNYLFRCFQPHSLQFQEAVLDFTSYNECTNSLFFLFFFFLPTWAARPWKPITWSSSAVFVLMLMSEEVWNSAVYWVSSAMATLTHNAPQHSATLLCNLHVADFLSFLNASTLQYHNWKHLNSTIERCGPILYNVKSLFT